MRSGTRSFAVGAAAAMLVLAAALPVSAAKPTPTLTQTVCAPGGGPDLQVTITWSDVNANAWSAAALGSDGVWDYGAGYQPLPKTVSSGSQTHTFPATNAYNGAQSSFAIGYIYMGSSSNVQNSKGFPGGTGGENRPAAGWPAC
jgi:hypothetical protein